GVPGGRLRALAGVERGVERLPVVALIHRLVRALQRVLGGGELLARVLIRAGGARGVDRALGLLHFLVRRIAARRGRRRRRDEGERQQETTRGGHENQYNARVTLQKAAGEPSARPL